MEGPGALDPVIFVNCSKTDVGGICEQCDVVGSDGVGIGDDSVFIQMR